MSPRFHFFILLPQGFKSFPSDLLRMRWCNLVYMECLWMIKLMMVGFCSVGGGRGGWCYSGWYVWDLRTLAQFQGSEMFPELFQDFMDSSWRNKHDSFWHVVLTEYFYVISTFLWVIVVSNFLPLKIYKNLVLSLSTCITFTANSQADNYFYKYICVSNIIQKSFFYRKKSFFSVDYVKINELHVIHTWCCMQS